MLIVDRGSMFCNRSEEKCLFFDIDVKGGEKSPGGESSPGVESECMRVPVLPSMPKGEIVGKYVTDNEWHEYRKNVQRIVSIFTGSVYLSLMASTVVVMA
jgi:hypothetical protein